MHKFTIEYDLYAGLRDDGRNHCLGIYDTLEDARKDFWRCVDTAGQYFNEVPIARRRNSTYLVATYCWEVDADGEITCNDAWDELSDQEKEQLNKLSFTNER
jgi:hypothetical protein